MRRRGDWTTLTFPSRNLRNLTTPENVYRISNYPAELAIVLHKSLVLCLLGEKENDEKNTSKRILILVIFCLFVLVSETPTQKTNETTSLSYSVFVFTETVPNGTFVTLAYRLQGEEPMWL